MHLARLPPQEYARLAMLAAAPSKVPFYIAGGLLAAWAVVLAVNGIRRPGVPGSKAGQRGVIGTSLLLVLATVAMAVLTAGEEHEGEAVATSTEATLTADPDGGVSYDRKELAVKSGTVTITLVNDAALGHNVAVAQGDRELGRSDTISEGETELKVDLRPGEYEFYCTVAGHRAAGMEGTLTVQ
jgi:plastocyanin